MGLRAGWGEREEIVGKFWGVCPKCGQRSKMTTDVQTMGVLGGILPSVGMDFSSPFLSSQEAHGMCFYSARALIY